ncbi:MAG: hypothetical protein RIS36_2134 [Pseudomonadota bacterium]
MYTPTIMRHLLQIARYCALSLVITITLAGCGQDGEDDNQVNLRFINAVSNVSSVNFLVDGDVWFEDLEYVQETGYFTFDTDQHLFQVVPSDSLTPMSNLLTMLSDDKDYTYIAIGSALDATALMLVDNNEKAGEGSFKLRIINGWQSTKNLNVYVVASGQNYQNSAPAAKSIRYKSVTTYLTGKATAYDIVVTNASTGTVLASLSDQVFESEEVYTMVIAQSPTLENAPILQLIDDSED